MESAIIQRVKELLRQRRQNVTQFAAEIGMQQPTVNNYIIGKRSVSYAFIESILNNIPELSAEWLLKGEGEMYKEPGHVFVDDKRLEHDTCSRPV